jgi:uncharacterized protein
MMNPVVHFEMPADDRSRMIDFYSKAFGWKANQLGPEMGDYVVVDTAEVGPDKFPTEKGRINGGFFQKTPDNAYPSIVIGVEDIRAAMKRVTDAGGKVLGGAYKAGEPDEIPGVGLYCSFIDSEGNRAAMLQPSPMPGKEANA